MLLWHKFLMIIFNLSQLGDFEEKHIKMVKLFHNLILNIKIYNFLYQLRIRDAFFR